MSRECVWVSVCLVCRKACIAKVLSTPSVSSRLYRVHRMPRTSSAESGTLNIRSTTVDTHFRVHGKKVNVGVPFGRLFEVWTGENLIFGIKLKTLNIEWEIYQLEKNKQTWNTPDSFSLYFRRFSKQKPSTEEENWCKIVRVSKFDLVTCAQTLRVQFVTWKMKKVIESWWSLGITSKWIWFLIYWGTHIAQNFRAFLGVYRDCGLQKQEKDKGGERGWLASGRSPGKTGDLRLTLKLREKEERWLGEGEREREKDIAWAVCTTPEQPLSPRSHTKRRSDRDFTYLHPYPFPHLPFQPCERKLEAAGTIHPLAPFLNPPPLPHHAKRIEKGCRMKETRIEVSS